MVFHLKTTLTIDDGVMRRLKEEAARRGCTMSELVESALRALLRSPRGDRAARPELPSWNMGQMLADVADRDALDALYQAMEQNPSPPRASGESRR